MEQRMLGRDRPRLRLVRLRDPSMSRAASTTSPEAHRAAELAAAQSEALLRRLETTVDRFAGPLAQPCRRIVLSRGGRLRPALTLACAYLAGAQPRPTDVVGAGAAIELMHCATLVHDDIIDAAATRRGVATINAAEGADTAIVAGDVLIAASLATAAELSPDAAGLLAGTLARLCAGQSAEAALRCDLQATPAQVLQATRDKTGSLMRAACVLGGLVAELDTRLIDALARFGCDFGVCLQLVDDLLDLLSTEDQLGKPVGADVAAGTMTVPVVACLSARPALGPLIGAPIGTSAHQRALHIIRDSAAIADTTRHVRELAAQAAADLRAAAPAEPTVAALAGWPQRYVETTLRDKVAAPFRALVPEPSERPAYAR